MMKELFEKFFDELVDSCRLTGFIGGLHVGALLAVIFYEAFGA